MSLFGWSYPPGCDGPPDEPEDCDVCGARDCDACVCRWCRTCGDTGNPGCYADLAHLPAVPDRRRCGAAMHPSAEQLRRHFKRMEEDKRADREPLPEPTDEELIAIFEDL